MISPVVEAIGRMHFEGNVIPHCWYRHPLLRAPSGTVNQVAVTILADVVYWYRPQVLRDEATGQVVDVRQRFRADMLQKSYQAWAELFGYTKRQVKDAVLFLRKCGLIRVEFRTVTTEGGLKLANVLFVEPVAEKIAEISDPSRLAPDSAAGARQPAGGGLTFKRHTSDGKTSDVRRSGVRGVTLRRQTNTETTTENTTEITTHTRGAPSEGHGPPPAGPGVGVKSKYTPEEILPYVLDCRRRGQKIDNPEGLAIKLARGGEADSFVAQFIGSQTEKQDATRTTGQRTSHPPECSGCFGTNMEVVPGKGARRCKVDPEARSPSRTHDTRGESVAVPR